MRYDAFISYRHSDLDMYVAKKLHKGLEIFKVPRAVAKKYGKKSIKRVFRDQEELPIGSDLGDNIANALRESEYLLVICSPRTPESYWVQKEIDSFIQMHGRDHVLAILIEGEPNQSFPAQLLVDDAGNPVEPLAADVRGQNKREVNKKLKTEIMRLAAPILGCTYDDLRQRHRERKIKRVAAMAMLVAVMAVAFGAYSIYNAKLIQQNYEGKLRNQSKYLADRALTLLAEGDRRAAVLVAMEALPTATNERPYVAEAQYALAEALYCYDAGSKIKMDRTLQHDLPVREFYFSESGTRAVSIDQSYNVYAWNVETGEKLAQIAPRIDEYGYIASPVAVYAYEDNILLCEEEALRLLDYGGEELWKIEFPSNAAYCLFDETTAIAACVNWDEVVFVDVAGGKITDRLVNEQGTSFSAEQKFNSDRSRFAVSHINTDDGAENGCVTVYDFKTKEVTALMTGETYIMDMFFTPDNCLVVVQSRFDDFLTSDDNIGTCLIEKISCESGETMWQNAVEYQLIGNESASAQVKCRENQVLMSVDNHAYTWDLLTGECIAHVQVDDGISDFLVASNSQYAFLAQYDGTVDIVNMATGTKFNDAAVETGKLIRQLYLRSGVMVFRSYASPDLTVMRYPEQADCAELATFEEAIKKVESSKEETYYAVTEYDFDVSSRVSFYRTEDDSWVHEWTEEKNGTVDTSGFIDDSTYVLMGTEGVIKFFDLETADVTELDISEEFYAAAYYMNHSRTRAMVECGGAYGIVDLQKRKLIATGEIDGFFMGAVLSEDGERIYCSVKEQGVCIINVSDGELISLKDKGYEVFSGSQIRDTFAVGENGRLLAVGCVDGTLRVLDVESLETVAKIPFTGVNRSFIRFIEDDTRIIMQGDDYYFRVYDLQKAEFAYIATEQYNQIMQCILDGDTQSVVLITSNGILMLNAEDYTASASVDGGVAYLPERGMFLVESDRTIYKFPYLSLEMLQEEALRQFGDQPLTELERIKYNVE